MSVEELYGSPTETGGEAEPFNAQRVYQVEWENRISTVESLMDGHYPGNPAAKARRFSIEGHGQSGGLEDLGESGAGVLEYEFAQITIEYSTARADGSEEPEDVIEEVEEDEYLYRVVERFEPTAEFLIPGNASRLSLPYGGEQVEAGPGEVRPILVRGGAYIVRVPDVLYLPNTWFDDLGKINADALASLTIETAAGIYRQFPGGTLQYAAMTADRDLVRSFNVEEQRYLWTVEFRFAYRAEAWNMVPVITDAGAIEWVQPEINGNPYSPHEEMDFTASFRHQWRIPI